MLGPEGDIWTLCWKLVEQVPSLWAVLREEIWSYLDALSEVQWRIFSLFAVVECLLFSSHYMPPCKIYVRVAQLWPFGSRWCWKMAPVVMGSSRHGIIQAPWWWHFLRKSCRVVEYSVGKNQRNLSLVILLSWWHIRDGTDNGSLRDQDFILLLHVLLKFLSQLVFH